MASDGTLTILLPLRNPDYATVSDYALCWLRIELTYFFFRTATLGGAPSRRRPTLRDFSNFYKK